MPHGFQESSPADRERLLRLSLQLEGCKNAGEFHGQRPRRFVLLSSRGPGDAGKARAPLPPQAKTLILVRHGEGVHNEWREAEFAAGRTPHAKRANQHEVPAELHDPKLTAHGEAEVEATREARERERGSAPAPELLVTSPLRRAIQTCLCVFRADVGADLGDGRRCKAVAHELAREQFRGLDPSLYDSRLDLHTLASQFPDVAFEPYVLPPSPSPDGTAVGDPLWWHSGSVFGGCEGGHHAAAMASNAYGLLCWLMSRAENTIGVATHSILLLALYHGCLDLPDADADALAIQPGGRHDGPQFFATAELREVVIVELPPPPAAGAQLVEWRDALMR